jgi:hypothetical protein
MLEGNEASLVVLRGRERTMNKATVVLCSCGRRLVCEVARLGERLGLLDFFDNEPDSETHSQRVRECPGCGERLELHVLFRSKPGDQLG